MEFGKGVFYLLEGFKLGFKFTAFALLLFVIFGIWLFVAYKIDNKIGDYSVVTLPYVFCIALFYYLINTIEKKEKNNSIYMWLEKLDGSYNLLQKLFRNHKVKEDTLENLDRVYKELLVYTGHDIRKLRLLKAYFKSINNETSYDLFGKVFITFLFGLLATNLSNGNILNFINKTITHEIKVSPTYETLLDIIMVFALFIILIKNLMGELFNHKKRSKIIEEVLDVCINELES